MTPPETELAELLTQYTAPAAEALTRREPGEYLRCLACGHRCRIKPGGHGVCHVRRNEGGVLRVPWGYVSSLAVDPIEKKPFFHAWPGRPALSFGMLGCNFHCPFCQNWITSQTLRDQRAVVEPQAIEAERIVSLARKHDCPVLTSTYNEPLITCEWAVEIFRLGRAHGLHGTFVSNGHGTPEVLEYLRPYLRAMNIDLKAFKPETYRKLGGNRDHVLDTIRRAWNMGIWVEVVTLVVPGMNDSAEELTQIARFLAGLSPDIPWHVTAFHPQYKVTNARPTPADTLLRAFELGKDAGLHFVYAGNLPGRVGSCENTYCPGCGALLIERSGFYVSRNRLADGTCPDCGRAIPGVWS